MTKFKTRNIILITSILILLLLLSFFIPRWYFDQQVSKLNVDSSDNVIMCISESLSTQAQRYGSTRPRLFYYSRPESIIPTIALSYKYHIETDTQIYVILNTYTFFGIKIGEYVHPCYSTIK